MAQSFFIYRDPEGFKPLITAYGPGVLWTLHEVRIHLSGPCTFAENLTIWIDGGEVPAVYDTVLLTQPMLALSDVDYVPDAPVHMGRDDEIRVDFPNTDGNTHGVEIVFSTRE